MFGLTIDKLMVIVVIAVFIVGPTRLPLYASKLAGLVAAGRRMVAQAKSRLSEEMGPEFDEIEWTKLDPRQYDPRRIIREALLEETPIVRPPSRSEPAPTREKK